MLRRLTLCAAFAAGCLPDNPDGTTDSAGSVGTMGDGTDTSGGADGIFGCASGQTCRLVVVAQTLDDRIEVFAPEESPQYRGTIDLDLKPNPGGNFGVDELDEPFGLSVSPTALDVVVGHYPERRRGSLLSMPLTFLNETAVGGTVEVASFFDANSGAFSAGVVHSPFGEEEPIFVHRHESGRLLIAVFNNDLFAGEETWTNTGKILVVDPATAGAFGSVDVDFGGNACAGASDIVDIGGGRVAVACDGNETIALLDVSGVGNGEPQAAADSITGQVCDPIPGTTPGMRRVRYLAANSGGGAVVLDAPIRSQDPIRVWQFGADCTVAGTASLDDGQIHEAGEIVQVPTTDSWLLTNFVGNRGIYAASTSTGQLEVCPTPIGGLDGQWGGTTGPTALALALDGETLKMAIGVAERDANPTAPGLGRVVWAELDAATAICSLTATTVVDLTDGGAGRAPAVLAADPKTWRRGPNVVEIVEISG